MWSKEPPPTREEAARIELAKTGLCMACLALQMQELLDPELVVFGCDYNHAKSGNLRRGHMESRIKRLSARYHQVLNEMVRCLFAVAVREIQLLKELSPVRATEHRVLDQILGVLEAPDRVKACGSSFSHQVAVMLQLKHGIRDGNTFHGMHDITSRHISVKGQLGGHRLSESHNSSIPAGEPSVIFSPLSLGGFLSGHRPFIRSDSDSAKNGSNAAHCLNPCWPNLAGILVHIDAYGVKPHCVRQADASNDGSAEPRYRLPIDGPHLTFPVLNAEIVCGGRDAR